MTKDHMTGTELGQKLLESVRQMKAGKIARVTAANSGVALAATARQRTGFSQSAFASLLGVSVRTLQDWEQGRREPSGAARTLLRIAAAHPEAVLEVGA
ncbi:MAG: helix-turn-helix domain-containing protein [Azoarcus sp.]|jgi:putative transcriptional regulator|nr:helix-turn-helix domain-containing protein [Azoarcus sp.]